MVTGVIVLTLLAAVLGVLLVATAGRGPTGAAAAIDRVNAVLPQIQCAQCGYPGCRPYAAALVAGAAPLDRCPPGGEATRRQLAALLGSARAGQPLPPPTPARVAVIDEAACIGCALCLPPCPVDAIVGAPRHLHTVIAAACTGCELCIPACPVDCIALVASPRPASAAVAA